MTVVVLLPYFMLVVVVMVGWSSYFGANDIGCMTLVDLSESAA